LTTERAKAGYLAGLAQWSRDALGEIDAPSRLADLSFAVTDAVIARSATVPDLADRWRAAEAVTDERLDEVLAVLAPDDLAELRDRLVALIAV